MGYDNDSKECPSRQWDVRTALHGRARERWIYSKQQGLKKPFPKQISNILQSSSSNDVLLNSESCTTDVTVTHDTVTAGRIIYEH